jgi:hypothetical protein
MPKATEVFTPTDVPTFTYVERSTHKFEQRLREAFSIPKMVISISGPSKSGKTVLVNKVIEKDNLIQVSGASITTPDDLWMKVLAWMGSPSGVAVSESGKIAGDVSTTVGGKAGIPFIAEGKADVTGTVTTEAGKSTTKTIATDDLQRVVKDIGNSEFSVFIDDFHYIEKSVRETIGKQIKEAAERGVRIITASVPHRADDVVRSNPELRGRVTAIDMHYWSGDELEQIVHRGFDAMNMDVAPSVSKNLANEAFGSPQLMQAICLNFCFENSINQSLSAPKQIDMDFVAIQRVLERTSTITDFSSMLAVLHSGPKQRGLQRKEFTFNDGTRGDVYRCVLLAVKADPSRLSFPYEEMLKRTQAVCSEDSPTGSSVAQALVQMAELAGTVQLAPVIEWDENVLDIVEPYFLFFLRCSDNLKVLARK